MTAPDVFTHARETLTVPDVWVMLDLPGEPRPSCRSPFREERTASFSIYENGSKWTDHGVGLGGDVIEFISAATSLDHRGVRQWLIDRLNLAHCPAAPRKAPVPTVRPAKVIEWPGELIDGTEETWRAFAKSRGITFSAAWLAAKSGILKFCIINGVKCYVITDAERRAAEIRRIDRGMFGTCKAYPLKGVDKRWLPGAAMLRPAKPDAAVLLVEGATDLLSAMDLWIRYGKATANFRSWVCMAVLGAGCKQLDPECAALIAGRHVRIVPDADTAGDKMLDHWTDVFRNLGCPVDHVTLPRNTDLTDNFQTINSKLFSL